MNDSPQPAESGQPADNKQPTGKPAGKRPFQFGLKHLLLLMFLAALPFAAGTWWELLYIGIVFSGIVALISTWLIVTGMRNDVDGQVFAGVVGILVSLCILWLSPTIDTSMHRPRAPCLNNLKYIILALQAYHDDHGTYPPAYLADENGRPMHSWRVLLLPQLGDRVLYDLYDFDEPWDGPNNSKLAAEMSKVFSCPQQPRAAGDYTTSYVVVIGPHTLWPGKEARKYSDINDGTSNTIAVVEVADSGIHWMEPRDLDFQQMMFQINPKTGQGISGHHKGGACTAFADGSVHVLRDSTDSKILEALLTIDGGEEVGDF